jgi:hypothetical protein
MSSVGVITEGSLLFNRMSDVIRMRYFLEINVYGGDGIHKYVRMFVFLALQPIVVVFSQPF